ncbi:MAG: NADPH-dependent glutamate synthase [Chloroflexi bacterium]|nr:NADPH-dependent glutamate synthase [Chloroflexota bacterium]
MGKDLEIQRRLAISRVPINKQDPQARKKNWDEVFLGFDIDHAKIEAMRCLHCPTAPCQEACPVHNDIPGAFTLLEQGDVGGAAETFRQTSNLPELCGRLCPQERLCEGECVVAFAIRPDSHQEPPVSIGKLEAFVTDYQRKHLGVPLPAVRPASGFKVAVVGAGPAGLAVAEELSKLGHSCVMYDAWPEPGGVLLYGIPNFKLSKEVLQDKLKYLEHLGVGFIGNTWIGKDVTIDDLFNTGFDAVFVGTGAGLGGTLAIQGEELRGIHAATEFLVRGNLRPEQLPEHMREPLRVGRNVVVIGGGDTSMDCVRTAVRIGAEHVTCIYRRTEAEMPGRGEEREHARQEGVNFQFLTIPLRFIGDADGNVAGVECQRMALGDPDESGRRRPVPVPHSEFVLDADTIAIAIGYNADPIIKDAAPGVATDRWNLVEVHPETFMTTRPGVFAGGDNVNGADLVVTALADGRRAALAIHEYLDSLPPRNLA